MPTPFGAAPYRPPLAAFSDPNISLPDSFVHCNPPLNCGPHCRTVCPVFCFVPPRRFTKFSRKQLNFPCPLAGFFAHFLSSSCSSSSSHVPPSVFCFFFFCALFPVAALRTPRPFPAWLLSNLFPYFFFEYSSPRHAVSNPPPTRFGFYFPCSMRVFVAYAFFLECALFPRCVLSFLHSSFSTPRDCFPICVHTSPSCLRILPRTSSLFPRFVSNPHLRDKERLHRSIIDAAQPDS